jgi:plastocyanin
MRNLTKFSTVSRSLLALAALIAPQVVQASTTWQATVGAQSQDLGRQALAFLPNEVWVHVNDSITWTFATDEVHTVTFLTPGQIRPANQVGCPGITPNPSPFNNSSCVNSGRQTSGSYTVSFPNPGNFKLVCLVHVNMTGTVHVLSSSEPLPYDQPFYDFQANREGNALLADGAALGGQGVATAEQAGPNAVTTGIGEIVGTGGGSQSLSVMRFLRDTIVVHKGDTVEWTNLDPTTPHTITFGTEPANPQTLVGVNSNLDLDGARSASVDPANGSVSSGFIQATPPDRGANPLGDPALPALPQTPLFVTRFRVTFNTPGTFNYICALHDDLGMVGKVIVRP